MGAMLMELKEKTSGEEIILDYSVVFVAKSLSSGGCRLYKVFSYDESKAEYIDVCETKEEILDIIKDMFSDDDGDEDCDCEHNINESEEFGDLGDPL